METSAGSCRYTLGISSVKRGGPGGWRHARREVWFAKVMKGAVMAIPQHMPSNDRRASRPGRRRSRSIARCRSRKRRRHDVYTALCHTRTVGTLRALLRSRTPRSLHGPKKVAFKYARRLDTRGSTQARVASRLYEPRAGQLQVPVVAATTPAVWNEGRAASAAI